MSVFSRIKLAAVAGILALAPSVALAEAFTASLDGGEEVPANTTVANGFFIFNLSNISGANSFTLRYADLEGQITMAHIHVGQPGVNGGIMIWLCQTAASPAPAAVSAATPQCPLTASALVSGTISAAQVLAVPAQLVDAGDLNEVLVRALRSGKAYVNVHTTVAPGGEIRGQIE